MKVGKTCRIRIGVFPVDLCYRAKHKIDEARLAISADAGAFDTVADA